MSAAVLHCASTNHPVCRFCVIHPSLAKEGNIEAGIYTLHP